MICFPNAKINLGLNVVSKRTDGYHNIETVFHPAGIKDVLEIIEAPALSFQSTGLGIPGESDSNICLKAYALLKKDFKLPPVCIHLHKNIPIGAGLGGGSSDGAFTIKLLNSLFDLNLSVPLMQQYAAELGADCAFFILNKPVFASGTGTVFEDIDININAYSMAVVMPPVHVSTSIAYNGITPQEPDHSIKEIVRLPVESWKNNLKNDFELSVYKRFPSLSMIKGQLYENGAVYASMSGSGSAFYALFNKGEQFNFSFSDCRVYFPLESF